MAKAKRLDAVSCVEAAYQVDLEPETWARGLVHALAPELDAGFGVVGYLVKASARYSSFEVGAGPLPEGALQAVHDMSVIEDFHSLLHRPQVATVSELLPPTTARAVMASSWWGKFGVHDAIGVVSPADAEHSFVVSAPLPRTTVLTAQRRNRIARYATHIGAALRLRRTPVRQAAFVRPNGVVDHAQGRASERQALEQLRRRAVDIDRARSGVRRRDPDEALLMWKGLVDGQWSLIERFERDGRRYYVACENPPDGRGPRSLTRRERQVLELACRGQSNKLTAYALGISEAATSAHLRRALTKLGIPTRAELTAFARTITP